MHNTHNLHRGNLCTSSILKPSVNNGKWYDGIRVVSYEFADNPSGPCKGDLGASLMVKSELESR